MKKIYLIILTIIVSSSCFAQKFEFNAYGQKSQHGVMPVPSNLIVEKVDEGAYSIIAYDPRHSDVISMDINVKFLEKHQNNFYYDGTVSMGDGHVTYNCMVVTEIDLLEFAKGEGGSEYYAYKRKHRIEIFYGRGNVNTRNYQSTVSVFPINTVLYQKKQERKKQEIKRREQEIKEQERYDLIKYDKAAYDDLARKLKQKIIRYFEHYGADHSRANFIPTYTDLLKADESNNKYRFKNIYNVHYKLEDHSQPSFYHEDFGYVHGSRKIEQVVDIILVEGTDNNKSLFKRNPINTIKIPTIEIAGNEVMTEAIIENIEVDYIKGITYVEINRKGNVELIDNKLSDNIIHKIKEEINVDQRGKFILKYEYSNIMGDENLNIEQKEIKREFSNFWILLVSIPAALYYFYMMIF